MASKRKLADCALPGGSKKGAKIAWRDPRPTGAFFLTLLPPDIQRDIFENWLVGRDDHSGLQQALSALDVACCFAPLREPFLALASSMAFSSIYPAQYDGRPGVLVPNRMLNYLAWVQDRRIAVKTLTLSGESTQTGITQKVTEEFLKKRCTRMLPSVEHVFLASATGAHLLTTVLTICPNVTSVEGKRHIGGMAPKVNEHMWSAVCGFPSLKLTRLAGCGDKSLRKALKTFGHCLEHLHLINPIDEKVVFDITDHCSKLKVLQAQFTDKVVVAEDIVNLVTACEELEDITFPVFTGTVADIEAILAAGKHLKKVRFSAATRTTTSSKFYFLELLERHPYLDVVGCDGCLFDRNEGLLELRSDGLQLEEVRLILTKCVGARKFKLFAYSPWSEVNVRYAVAEILGSTLKDVELWGSNNLQEEVLLHIPLACPLLERLTLHYTDVSDAGLKLIGDKCKNLREFSFGRLLWKAESVTDAGMEALFAGCSKLKVVEMTGDAFSRLVTFKTLEAIVTHKLRLERFIWVKCTISEEDEARYRALAREHSLLPVPLVIEA